MPGIKGFPVNPMLVFPILLPPTPVSESMIRGSCSVYEDWFSRIFKIKVRTNSESIISEMTQNQTEINLLISQSDSPMTQMANQPKAKR